MPAPTSTKPGEAGPRQPGRSRARTPRTVLPETAEPETAEPGPFEPGAGEPATGWRRKTEEVLARASAILVRTGDPTVALPHIMKDLGAFGVDGYVNYVVDRRSTLRLVRESASGIPEAVLARFPAIELNSNVSGRIAQDGVPIIMFDVMADTGEATATAREVGINAIAGHPLISQGNVLGTLLFFSTTRRDFPPEAIALMRDICDQVAAVVERSLLLRELREHDAMMRRAMDAAKVGTWDWHVDTDALETSPGYGASVRGRAELVLTRSSDAINSLYPEDQAHVRATLREVVEGGLTRNNGEFRFEYRVGRPDGDIRWISSQGRVLEVGPDGRAVLVAGVAVDVTDRRLAEDAQRQSEARLQASLGELERSAREAREQAAMLKALHATARVGLAVQNTDLRFTMVNDYFAEFLGLPISAVVGRTRREVAPAIADQTEPLLRQVLAKGMPIDGIEFTYEIPGRPGKSRTCLKSFYPVRDGEGRVVGVGEALLDMTDKRRADDRARHTERLQTVGRLAAGVAHDFNNILHIIIGNLDLLTDDEIEAGETRPLVAVAMRAAQRGAYLTQELLAYTRQQILTPKRLDVAGVIAELRLQLERSLGPRIDLEIQIRRPVASVIADRAQLEAALTNLVANAAHAMPAGGGLRLELYAADGAPFGELKPGGHAVIAVVDTGVGIPPNILDRVFEPFFTTKGLDGTGLGLSMVQGFSRQSGGDTRVLSRPGQGTRVEIWLPAAPDAAAKPEHVRPPGSRGHILLVDDMPDVLNTTASFLERSGFTLERAEDGNAALALVTAGRAFDMLVTDYFMPGMSGVELVARVRALEPRMPALMITGFAEIMDYVPEEHGTKLLRKPFQRDRLIAVVNAMLGEYSETV